MHFVWFVVNCLLLPLLLMIILFFLSFLICSSSSYFSSSSFLCLLFSSLQSFIFSLPHLPSLCSLSICLDLIFFLFLLFSCFLVFFFFLSKSLPQTSPFWSSSRFQCFGCFVEMLLSLLLVFVVSKICWSKLKVATQWCIFWQPPVFKSVKSQCFCVCQFRLL